MSIFYQNLIKINLLNGCVITSGQEFFKSLGMQFEDTGELHTEGKHKGEPIQKASIKSKEDIPEKVLEYFNYSNEFMCNLIGKENVVYSAIHFDENTPHMHFYFTPVVHEVKRKVFETDKDGHQILKPYITKDGIEKMIPIQKKDDYNKFINGKGFNLDRGEIGANKHHLTKAEKQLKDLQEQNKLLELELSKNKAINEVEISYKDKISDVDTNPLLNPEKGKIMGYKEKDITNLSNYSKEITKDNLNKSKIIEQNEISLESKQNEINKLNTEIKNLKSGKTLQDKDKIIENQKLIIREKDKTIEYQNNIIESLKQELSNIKEMATTLLHNVKGLATDLYKALKRTLGLDVDKNQKYDYSAFKDLSKKINKKYE